MHTVTSRTIEEKTEKEKKIGEVLCNVTVIFVSRTSRVLARNDKAFCKETLTLQLKVMKKIFGHPIQYSVL